LFEKSLQTRLAKYTKRFTGKGGGETQRGALARLALPVRQGCGALGHLKVSGFTVGFPADDADSAG
jgi:hypothetical protein